MWLTWRWSMGILQNNLNITKICNNQHNFVDFALSFEFFPTYSVQISAKLTFSKINGKQYQRVHRQMLLKDHFCFFPSQCLHLLYFINVAHLSNFYTVAINCLGKQRTLKGWCEKHCRMFEFHCSIARANIHIVLSVLSPSPIIHLPTPNTQLWRNIHIWIGFKEN